MGIKLAGRILRWLVLFCVPLGFVIATVVAPLMWVSTFNEAGRMRSSFTVVEQPTTEEWTPDLARAKLSKTSPVESIESGRSEAWFWIGDLTANDKDAVILFKSRHTRDIQCWEGQREIGIATRKEWVSNLRPSMGGFALEGVTDTTLCRVKHIGPASISIDVAGRQAFGLDERSYERKWALLEGGMAILALTSVIAAIINRSWSYWLMASWVILSMRVAALSFGADYYWYGYLIPSDWMSTIRALTVAFSAAATWLLFREIFGTKLQVLEAKKTITANHIVLLALVTCAAILPYKYYLPVMWFGVSLTSFSMLALLLRILANTKAFGYSGVFYASSLVVMISGAFSEILAAALGERILTEWVNNTLTCFISGLLMVVAVIIHERGKQLTMSSRLSMAHEEQSRTLAREIHDSLGGALSILRLGLFSLMQKNCDTAAKVKIKDILALADDAIKITRDITHALHPLTLDSLGLAATVRWYAETFEKSTGIKSEVSFDDPDMPREHKHAVFRAIQEVLSNVAKHSHATYVLIRGKAENKRFVIDVEDNGKGGAVKPGGYKGSLGLISITERLTELGGNVSIKSPIGDGTRVSMHLPFRSEEWK